MSGPLAGVRVLDFSAMLSGPWAADILGDQGADVIKVEPPGSGDHVRGMYNQRNGMSAWFANINRSKRSICLDLKSTKGVEIARRLASEADVAVQNFRPGVATRLGIDYDSLRADRLPAALIQGLRDFFGAHTYRRVDKEGTFHTAWATDERAESDA